MPLIPSTYKAPWYLPGPDAQSIYTNFCREKIELVYRPEVILTRDDDDLELFWQEEEKHDRLIVLTHGLTGNAKRNYMQAMARAFHQSGYDTLSWNFRGCGGIPNRKPYSYHSGFSQDLEEVVFHAIKKNKYRKIALIGFSMGANVVLKYIGEKPDQLPDELDKAVVFSCPCHLSSCSDQIENLRNKPYKDRFLKRLRKQVEIKHQAFPGQVPLDLFSKVKRIRDFDEYYTARLNGFDSAEDYYQKCMSLNWLHQIDRPTLIVNAKNDFLLSPLCYPKQQAKVSKHLFLEIPATGGHTGFPAADEKGWYWSERRALEFMEENFNTN